MSEGTSERKVRVLIVDDNPGDVHLLRLALDDAQLDFELTVIDDGAEALAFVRQPGEDMGGLTPELVVLDWNLPKTDGLEILEAVKTNGAFSGVPIVVMSSGLSPDQVLKVEQFHVEYCTSKPCTLEEFLKIGLKLKVLIEISSRAESAAALA